MTHRMPKSAIMTISLLLADTGVACGQASSDLIFPDTAHEIQVVTADKCKSKLPGGRVLPESDSLARLVL